MAKSKQDLELAKLTKQHVKDRAAWLDKERKRQLDTKGLVAEVESLKVSFKDLTLCFKNLMEDFVGLRERVVVLEENSVIPTPEP